MLISGIGEVIKDNYATANHDNRWWVGLVDWRSFDDPLKEHVLHYPQCPFILGCNAERGRQGNSSATFSSTNSYSNLQDQPHEYSYQTTLMIARSSSSRSGRSVVGNSTTHINPTTNELRTAAFENIKSLIPGSADVTADKKIDIANTQKRQEPLSLKQSILAEMNILSGEPCCNHFVTYSARISSFASWPKQTTICGQMLADAGFYYTGEKDRTRCFYCGVTLVNWEKGDIPWDMHDRYNPKCNFLLLCRNMSPESSESCSKMLSKVDDQLLMETLETVDGKGSLEELNDRMPSWRGQDAVRFALDAGYDEGVISKALIANSYEMFESASELVDRIDTLLLIDSKNCAAKDAEDNKQRRDNAARGEKNLLSHQKHRHNSKSCFICLDAETSVVFLPCAHLVCCPRCSLAMTQCPICRTAAQGRLRIYILRISIQESHNH
uniref:RING-type domain-containing protein n=1 Tax=Romanomermis culicivorax TaxID=13658 RepID=A0A915KCC3_ROMCU